MATRILILVTQLALLLPLAPPAAPTLASGSRAVLPTGRLAGVPAIRSALPLSAGLPPSRAAVVAASSAAAGWSEAAGWPAAAPMDPSVRTAPPYQWPVDGPVRVARRFDPPPRPWLAGHRGVDLAAASGVPIRAAGTGVVRHAGEIAGRGVVSVAHEGGLRTTYEPVRARVSPGDRVFAGDQLGVLTPGHRGCPESACLHWGLRRGEVYLDPLLLLGLGRVRLLPLNADPAVARPSIGPGLFSPRA